MKHDAFSRNTALPRRAVPRSGFSLVEVALALIVASFGLLSVFGIFPVSLRQSQMSRSDMVEGAFASALLQTLGGNIRMIDDISVWNDPKKFWKAAAEGTGLSATITDGKNGSKYVHDLHLSALDGEWTGHPFSPMTTYVAHHYGNESSDAENIWFVAAEREKPEDNPIPAIDSGKLVQPAQYLVRLACIRRPARKATGKRSSSWALPTGKVYADPVGKWEGVSSRDREAVLPNIYVLSVVSSDRYFPDVFIHEPVFSQEFTFIHRP